MAQTLCADEGNQYAAILATVRSVAARAGERRDEIDKARKFPADLYDELEATGAFKVCGPKSIGGLELTLAQANQLLFEGARGNGSLGWLMMIAISQSIGGGLYPEETIKKVHGEQRFLRTRGVIAPKGKAVPVEGGYLVSGQWPFASGGPNPHYVSGHCVVMEEGKPKMSADGYPQALMAMMPAEKVEFLDTWRTLGMRGSDSCDVKVTDVFVPAAMTFDLLNAATCFDTPPARLPLRVALSFSHCALALGIGQGALDDLIELAKTKRASMNPKALLGDDPVFRENLGRRMVEIRAARAMLDQITSECWDAGVQRRQLSAQEILTARLSAHHITDACQKIVTWCYTAAGSAPVYDGSALQTRLRDIHVATQHASCHTDPYRLLGAVALGETLSARELF